MSEDPGPFARALIALVFLGGAALAFLLFIHLGP